LEQAHVVRFLGDCGEVRFEQVFIDGTMLEARANRHTAVWRKNVERYEEGQREKIRGIIRELKGRAGTAFSEDGEGILEQAKGARAYIGMKLEGAEGAGERLRCGLGDSSVPGGEQTGRNRG
jgi:hypothetical protein